MVTHDFYELSSQFSPTTIRVSSLDLDPIPDPTGTRFFDSDRLVLGDYGPLKFPILFKQEKGRKWDDVLNTGYAALCLISDRMKTVLEENHLTGWKTYPIKILGKKGNEIPGYHGLSVIGRSGRLEYNKDEIIQKRFMEHGPLRNYYKGLYIDLDKWDGSDFFIPEGSTGTVVTKKTADILKEAKLTNVYLLNLADAETSESTLKMIERRRTSPGHS